MIGFLTARKPQNKINTSIKKKTTLSSCPISFYDAPTLIINQSPGQSENRRITRKHISDQLCPLISFHHISELRLHEALAILFIQSLRLFHLRAASCPDPVSVLRLRDSLCDWSHAHQYSQDGLAGAGRAGSVQTPPMALKVSGVEAQSGQRAPCY